MFILEGIIFVLSIILVGLIIGKISIKLKYIVSLLSFTILILTLHIVINDVRWQLYALYVAVSVLGVLVYFKTFLNRVLKSYFKITTLFILILLIVVSLVSVSVFPMYDLPVPNGDYLIGTESFVIEDESRIEMYSENSDEFRKTKIQMWYPAETIVGYEQAPWLEDGLVVARALSVDTGLPAFVLDHTENIMSNSYFDAPINNDLDEYPIVIISHGWRGFRNLHTDFAEELASLGYIVVSIDHSYGSVATVFEEEDIAFLNLDALPERETTTDFLDYANQLVYTYASDITVTLDYLEEINDSGSSSRFSGKLDLDNIGLLGHSTGGGADVAVAINDTRISSLLGLDAWVEPIEELEINKGLSIPSLFLRSGAWETGYNNTDLYQLIESSEYPSTLYQIDGITHYDFAMVYMYSPLTKAIGFTGDIESEELTMMLKSMITDFFDETLRDNPNSEIDIDEWGEVRLIATD